MKRTWTNLARYNCWANERLTAVISELPEPVANQEIVSSFPSVKLTLLHIWDAELLWLKRLQGVSLPCFPSADFSGNTAEACENVVATSREFQAFVEVQPEAFFQKTLSFKTMSFGAQQQRAFEIIQHCLNHSTYHRGQLVTMTRQLGLEKIPSTDFIYFLRQEAK
ncbi:MAG: DNA polymerase [Saprospiraceae bacterium]|nr:MAG: DNA polymerase [Saprospiraceae bacterium]